MILARHMICAAALSSSTLLTAANAQECQNAMSPLKDSWVWTYRAIGKDKGGKESSSTWQERVKASADGFERLNISEGKTTRAAYKCESGNITGIKTPEIPGVQINRAAVSGYTLVTDGDWKTGKTWQLVWNLEGRKGILSGTMTVNVNFRILGREQITVSAGQFDAYKVEQVMEFKVKAAGVPISPPTQISTLWFAEGVGLVKQDWGKNGMMELVNLKKQ